MVGKCNILLCVVSKGNERNVNVCVAEMCID